MIAYLLGIVSGMALLDIVRRASMIGWAIALAAVVRPFWRVITGKPRFYDMLWSMWGSVAFLILMYGIRALYAPNSVDIYIGLHVLSAVVAIGSIVVIRGYMRWHRATQNV